MTRRLLALLALCLCAAGTVADLDNDGTLDIAAANSGARTLSISATATERFERPSN